jgi:hypothetical protein
MISRKLSAMPDEEVAQQPTLGKRALSAKLRRVGQTEGYTFIGIGHWCPACRVMHAFAIDGPDPHGRRWTWNGDLIAPTFTPDRDLVSRGFTVLVPGSRCHYRLTAGVIEFFADCTHAMRAGVVRLPDLPGHLRD